MKRAPPEDPDDSPGPLFEKLVSEARRDQGMSNAVAGAEYYVPGWSTQAVQSVRTYALSHDSFLTEDVRAFAGTPEGVDTRAWGPVFKRAVALGYIKPDGYALANCSNRSPRVRWKSRLRG